MTNLYIDFDGVILDTIDNTNKMIKNAHISWDNTEAIDNFYENLDWTELLNKTKEINDSINSIQRIIDSNKFDVAILTHVNSLNEAIEKVNYLRQFFKDITIIPVPQKISKTKMVHTKDSILVDDTDSNLIEWEAEEGISVKFSKKITDGHFKTINKLDQLIDLFN